MNFARATGVPDETTPREKRRRAEAFIAIYNRSTHYAEFGAWSFEDQMLASEAREMLAELGIPVRASAESYEAWCANEKLPPSLLEHGTPPEPDGVSDTCEMPLTRQEMFSDWVDTPRPIPWAHDPDEDAREAYDAAVLAHDLRMDLRRQRLTRKTRRSR